MASTAVAFQSSSSAFGGNPKQVNVLCLASKQQQLQQSKDAHLVLHWKAYYLFIEFLSLLSAPYWEA